MTAPVTIRRRPIAMQAMQFDGHNAAEIAKWAGGDAVCSIDGQLIISTVGGEHVVEVGDWVIRGPEGHYPIEGSSFDELYVLEEPS